MREESDTEPNDSWKDSVSGELYQVDAREFLWTGPTEWHLVTRQELRNVYPDWASRCQRAKYVNPKNRIEGLLKNQEDKGG
jgi:hypothetical protein